MSTTVKIIDRPWSHPDSEYLRNLQRAEIEAIYDRPDSEPGTPPSADDISVFVVAYISSPSLSFSGDQGGEGGMTPIACGALRVLPPGFLEKEGEKEDVAVAAEVKRMYVNPDYRGKPWLAAKNVLVALEERAKENGWMNVVLETGRLQTAAIRFYEREGYHRIPSFGSYIGVEISLCYGKNLTRLA